jgi:nucleotide-binding universal stress UspA family protein
MPHRTVVVGYDGSPEAHRAARWALDEAARTGAPVEFCHAFEWAAYLPPMAVVPAPIVWPGPEVEWEIADMLAGAAADAALTHPRVAVSTALHRAPPAPALISRSADAALVVLGSRGHRAGPGILGSVAVAVSAHAHCPVVVVRGRWSAGDPIVAGVDGSDAAQAALAFAFAQAAARGVPLRVVRAWQPPALGWRGIPVPSGVVRDDEWRAVAETVERWREKYPGVKATHEVSVAHPAQALVEAALQAQLVVVGTRGRGAFRGTVLGSVSRHLLRHAECPVAVVHATGT